MPGKSYVAGNWKMNNSPGETGEFMKELEEIDPSSYGVGDGVEAIVFPPFISLERSYEDKPPWLKLGAQDTHFEESGAYTGEVSPVMLKEFELEYVIVGHSERRKIFGESDESINKKVKKLLELDFVPILCVGEDEPQRDQGTTFPTIEIQLKRALSGLDAGQIENIIIAYEPIWAIGTGKAATAEDACEVANFIYGVLESYNVNEKNIPVLYGGSVSPDNISSFVGKQEIDGALVGGKSLKPGSFMELIQGSNIT